MDFKIALLKDKQKTPGSIQAVIKDRLREWQRRVVTRLKSIQTIIKDRPKIAQLYVEQAVKIRQIQEAK